MIHSRYRPTQLRNGVVVQSGQNVVPRGSSRYGHVTRGPFRAIVLKTFVANSASSFSGAAVECEVLLVSTRQIVPRVRVMQPGGYGIHSAQPWVPRPTSKVTLGILTLSAENPATPFPQLSDFDGDTVLVDFLDGDLQSPVILGALQHEQTNRKVRSSQGEEQNPLDPDPNAAFAAVEGGWSEVDAGLSRGQAYDEEHYLNHRGTELRINRSGDVLLDTVGAFGPDDTESAPATTGKGQVRVRLKDLQKFTIECNGIDVLEVYKDLTGVHIDLGEGATEHVVLGDKLTTWLLAHEHPTAMGPSGAPVPLANGVSLLPVPPSLVGDHLSSQHRTK